MSEYPQQISTEHETPDDDYAGVTQAILDYVEGVYETDPSRIERSVHLEKGVG